MTEDEIRRRLIELERRLADLERELSILGGSILKASETQKALAT